MKLEPQLRRSAAYLYVQEILRGVVVELDRDLDEEMRLLLA